VQCVRFPQKAQQHIVQQAVSHTGKPSIHKVNTDFTATGKHDKKYILRAREKYLQTNGNMKYFHAEKIVTQSRDRLQDTFIIKQEFQKLSLSLFSPDMSTDVLSVIKK
jgi:hypothetical protein